MAAKKRTSKGKSMTPAQAAVAAKLKLKAKPVAGYPSRAI